MPAKSSRQRRFMGAVLAAKRGGTPISPKVAKAARSISASDAADFARKRKRARSK